MRGERLIAEGRKVGPIMELLRLPPPYWWRPGLSETEELQRATEAARKRDAGAPQYIQRSAELKEKRRVVNEAATHSAIDKLVNTTYRERYTAGDRTQLLRCQKLCAQVAYPLPSWAQEAGDRENERWQQALAVPRGYRSKPLTFERFLQGELRGRHSEADRLKALIICEGVELAKDWGIRGDRIFGFATECLSEYCNLLGKVKVSYSKAEDVERIYRARKASSKKLPRDVAVRMELTALMYPRLVEFPVGRISRGQRCNL